MPHNSKTSFVRSCAVPALLGVLAGICIVLFYRHNLTLFVLLAVLLGAILLHQRSRVSCIVAVIAAVYGCTIDLIYTQKYLWVYSNPSFLNVPIWVVFSWPITPLVGIEISEFLDRKLRARFSESRHNLVMHFLAMILAAYSAVVIFVSKPVAGSIMFLIMMFFAGNPVHIIYFFVLAFLAALGEIVCIQFGVWFYPQPYFSFFGFAIPFWLPFSWGVSANCFWIAAKFLENRLVVKR